MKRNRSIQLKAAFLLTVFGLNTVVGFACSMGLDMGFNTSHHDEEENTTEIHIHANGEKHHHKKETHKHDHKHGKDDCCNDSVIKLSQSDKSVPQYHALVTPIFFTAFISSYYNINIFPTSEVVPDIKYFVRRHHPTISDIRIAIQSFQI